MMPPITILVVDDEQDFLEIIGQRLGKQGFNVKTAENGQAALNIIATDEAPIETVVLDIAMPGMSGIETLKAIKKSHPLMEIIMLTGHGSVNSAVEAMKMGAFNYLVKPCEIEDLAAGIHAAMKRKRAREAKILDIRMTPFLTTEKRAEMIAFILKE